MDISPGIAPSHSPIPPDKEKTDVLDRSSLSTLNSSGSVASDNDQTSSKVSQNIADTQKVNDLSSSMDNQSIDSKEAEGIAVESFEEQQGTNENLSKSIISKRPDKKGSIEEKEISAKSEKLPDLIQSITKINKGEQSSSKENQKEQAVEIIEDLETTATDVTSDSKLVTEKVQRQTDSTLADPLKESAINGDDRKVQTEDEANSKIHEETNSEVDVEKTNSEMHVEETNAETTVEKANSEKHVKETSNEDMSVEETQEILSNSEAMQKENDMSDHKIEQLSSEELVDKKLVSSSSIQNTALEKSSLIQSDETVTSTVISKEKTSSEHKELHQQKSDELTDKQILEVEQSWSDSSRQLEADLQLSDDSSDNLVIVDETNDNNVSAEEEIKKVDETNNVSAEEEIKKVDETNNVSAEEEMKKVDETNDNNVSSEKEEIKKVDETNDNNVSAEEEIKKVDETNDNVSAEEIKKKVPGKKNDEKSKSASDSPSETPSKNIKGTKVQSDEISTLTSSKKTKIRFRKNTKDKPVEKLKLSCIKDTKSKNLEDTSIENWIISNSSVPENQEKEHKQSKQKSTAEGLDSLKEDCLAKTPVLKISKLEDEYHLKSSTPPASDVSSTATEPSSQNTKVPGRTPRNKIKKRPFSPTETMSSPVVSSPVTSSLPVVESMTGSQPKKKKRYSEEDVVKPFKFGWMREVVHRAAVGKKLTRQSDVYYFNPEGGKLRSTPEIAKYLAEHKGSGLTIENFTFVKETIYRKPFEQERDAKVKSTLIIAPDSSKKKELPSAKKAEVTAVKRKADSELNESIPAKKARLKEPKSDTPDKDSHVKNTKDAAVKNGNKLKLTKASADSSSKLKSKRDSLPTIKVKIIKGSPKPKEPVPKILTPGSGGEIEQDLRQILTSSSDKKEAEKRTAETESEKRTDKKGSEKETEKKTKASEIRKKARIKYTPPRSKKQTQNVYSAHH